MRLIEREHITRGNGEAFSPSNTTGSLFHMAQLPPVALPKARLRLQENSDFFLKNPARSVTPVTPAAQKQEDQDRGTNYDYSEMGTY